VKKMRSSSSSRARPPRAPQRKDEIEKPKRIAARGVPGGRALPLLLLTLCFFVSCRRDMYDQPKAKPLSENSFFKDGASARQIPAHTVAHGDADVGKDVAFSTGLTNGVLIAKLPVPLTPSLLSRGRERYDIYCAVCHGRTGAGNGEIVRRGFPAPPSFHVDRLRNAPIGHFFDVITHGYGVMYSYASRVEVGDRWAVAAYLRALQLSHNAKSEDVPPNERAKLVRQ